MVEYNALNFNENYDEEMLAKLGGIRKMFRDYVKNLKTLNDITKQGKAITDENKKETLRESYKKVQLEMQPWRDMITELKKKDTRKPVFFEKSIFKESGGKVERLLEFNDKTNKAKVISTQTII